MTHNKILFVFATLVIIGVVCVLKTSCSTKTPTIDAEIVTIIFQQRGIYQKIVGWIFGDDKNASIKAEYEDGRLIVFSCANCGIKRLPPGIGNLTQLESLNLAGNRLAELPTEIGNLTQLESLNLALNRLTSLPPEIGQLTQLEWFNLNGNQLTELPPEIGKLTQLQMLYLDGNQLTELPPEIGNLKQLKWLRLSGNLLTELPPEIKHLEDIEIER
jgi:Leucine-rich repeat (LRR) protein